VYGQRCGIARAQYFATVVQATKIAWRPNPCRARGHGPAAIRGCSSGSQRHQLERSRSESAVVAHFITCAAAAAIATTVSAIHSHPRRALPGDAPESSEGARTTNRSRRCLSRCVKLKLLPGSPTVVRVPVFPNCHVLMPRLPNFRRIPGRILIERWTTRSGERPKRRPRVPRGGEA
jgi:hypothetical protein